MLEQFIRFDAYLYTLSQMKPTQIQCLKLDAYIVGSMKIFVKEHRLDTFYVTPAVSIVAAPIKDYS